MPNTYLICMAWPVHIEHLIYIMDSTTAESHDCIINVRNKQFILSMLFEIWIFPFLLLVVGFFIEIRTAWKIRLISSKVSENYVFYL